MVLQADTIKRFWAKVEKRGEDECWPFLGSTTDGYGYMSVKNRRVGAHRIAFLACVRDLAACEHVLHKCDNRTCCNPKHLFSGTNADNIKDKMRKGRQQRGQSTGTSKLLDSQVEYMKLLLHSGVAVREVAEAYGVTTQHCYMVRAGKWQAHAPLWKASR
jgi:hypothetical protein